MTFWNVRSPVNTVGQVAAWLDIPAKAASAIVFWSYLPSLSVCAS